MAKDTKAGATTAPATLEEAVTQITELQTKLGAAEQAIEAGKKEAGDKIKELESDAKKLSKTITDQKAELEDAATVIEDLKSQIALNKGGKSRGPVVTIGKKKYLVKAGTVISAKPFSKEDIAADKDLCQRLLDKGSKLLTEIK